MPNVSGLWVDDSADEEETEESNGRGKRTNRALGRLVSRGYLTPEQAAPYFRKDNDDEFETFLNEFSFPRFRIRCPWHSEAAGGLEGQWIRPQDTCENYLIAWLMTSPKQETYEDSNARFLGKIPPMLLVSSALVQIQGAGSWSR